MNIFGSISPGGSLEAPGLAGRVAPGRSVTQASRVRARRPGHGRDDGAKAQICPASPPRAMRTAIGIET